MHDGDVFRFLCCLNEVIIWGPLNGHSCLFRRFSAMQGSSQHKSPSLFFSFH